MTIHYQFNGLIIWIKDEETLIYIRKCSIKNTLSGHSDLFVIALDQTDDNSHDLLKPFPSTVLVFVAIVLNKIVHE